MMVLFKQQLSTNRKPNFKKKTNLLITFYYKWLLWKSNFCSVQFLQ